MQAPRAWYYSGSPYCGYGFRKCVFVDILPEYIGPYLTIEYEDLKMWSNPFEHVSLWCLYFDPQLTTHQPHIGVTKYS